MKITRHKNGLKLYWDDLFFLYDGNGHNQSSYGAYVEASCISLKRITSANYHLMTPAQQIMWVPSSRPEFFLKHAMNPYARQWLEQNIGERGPDWYAREDPFDLMFLSVLFRLRRDALRFVHYINECLEPSEDQ